MPHTDIRPGGERREDIIRELTRAYWAELETVQNYLAGSTNLIGLRAEEVKKSLAADVTAELGHAQQLARRIHVLGGTVPGSAQFKAEQATLQPGGDPADVVHVINGVIDAESSAIAQYRRIAKLTGEVDDFVTQDMVVTILADEEDHLREFQNFLAEYRGRPK